MKKITSNKIYSFSTVFFIVVTSIIFLSFKTHEIAFYNQNPEYEVINCDTSVVYFKQQVLPILQTKCIMCHNPKKNMHGVLLNNYENILATIEIEEDDDDMKNELAKVILRNKMPPYPHEKLSNDQKNILLKWINQGMQNNSCEEALILGTDNLTFENSLKLIIEKHCIGCHSGKSPANGYDFSNKTIVMEVVKNGKLLKAINHEDGVTPMPFMSDKISEKEINTVRSWIENGMN